MPTYKIFGREPAAVLAFIAIVVKVGSAYVFHATTDQQATINTAAACVVALLIAISAHDSAGAALVNLIQGVLAAAVGFGLHVSADHQALLMSLIAGGVALWTRATVTAPVPPKTPALTAVRRG